MREWTQEVADIRNATKVGGLYATVEDDGARYGTTSSGDDTIKSILDDFFDGYDWGENTAKDYAGDVGVFYHAVVYRRSDSDNIHDDVEINSVRGRMDEYAPEDPKEDDDDEEENE